MRTSSFFLAVLSLAFSTKEVASLLDQACPEGLLPCGEEVGDINFSENILIRLHGSYSFYKETVEAMFISQNEPGILIFTQKSSSNTTAPIHISINDYLFVAAFGAQLDMSEGNILYSEMSPTDNTESFYFSSSIIKNLLEERNISVDVVDLTHILKVTWRNVLYANLTITFQIVMAKTTSDETYALLLYRIPDGTLSNTSDVTVGFNAGNGQPFESRVYELAGGANACSGGACVFRIDQEDILPGVSSTLSFDQPIYTVKESESTIITLSLDREISNDISVSVRPVPTVPILGLVPSIPSTVYSVTFPANGTSQNQSFTLTPHYDNVLHEPHEVFQLVFDPISNEKVVTNGNAKVVIVDDEYSGICGKLDHPEYGSVSITWNRMAANQKCEATYRPTSGYRLVGKKTRTCPLDPITHNCKVWRGQAPVSRETLTLKFTDDTPFVNGTFVWAKFEANRDDVTFICKLKYRRRWHSNEFITITEDANHACSHDSKSGFYQNATMNPSPIKYTLVIIATDGTEKATLRGQFRVYHKSLEKYFCGVHMINTISNNLSKVDQGGENFKDNVEFVVFRGVSVTCKMDNKTTGCGDDDERKILTPIGEQKIRVYNKNVKEFQIGKKRFVVTPEERKRCFFEGQMTYKFNLTT